MNITDATIQAICEDIKDRHNLSPFIIGSISVVLAEHLSGFVVGSAAKVASKPRAAVPPYKKVVELFGQLCPSFAAPFPNKISESRKALIKARWSEYSDTDEAWEHLRTLFSKAEASDFLTGRSGKGFSAGIDWVLQQGTSIKILEGTYDNGKQAPAAFGEQKRAPMTYQQIKDRLKDLRNRRDDILNPGGGGGHATEISPAHHNELSKIVDKIQGLLKIRKEYYND